MVGIKKFLKKKLLATFDEAQAAKILNSLRIENLEDQNWVQASLDQFKPLRFGKRLWIIPSWHEDKAFLDSIHSNHSNQNQRGDSVQNDDDNEASRDAGAIEPIRNEELKPVIIKLDPGLAFGTGSHETTALCLEWLDAHPPRNFSVIDYGSGSGILSLAAIMLGAKQVIAVDHDTQALQSTRNNAEKNGIPASQLITTAPEYFNQNTNDNNIKPNKADLILANILADPILELIPSFAELLKNGGALVLSGILKTQCPAIVTRLEENNFQDIEIETKGDWARISCKYILLKAT